ncbi:MAG: hypothetical protein OXU73_02085, partial [Candidatus Campbellbacteria bacterium]|nr:hypothetical protein [Candidatus Campbellbacteria bacterium]
LSLPRELRKNRDENMFFSRQIRMLKETGDVKGFLDILRDVAIENKWTVGYHTSSSDIRPKDNGEWNVDGTEEDHRDGDLSMAYYSMTYRNLYRDGKGREKYIYLVRAEESHRNEGGWYRAPSLSIIHKVSLSNIERQLEVERNRYNKSKADLYKNKKAA